MVVGAGRGPLVRATLNAAEKAKRKVKVYAVEKNPNAVLTYVDDSNYMKHLSVKFSSIAVYRLWRRKYGVTKWRWYRQTWGNGWPLKKPTSLYRSSSDLSGTTNSRPNASTAFRSFWAVGFPLCLHWTRSDRLANIFLLQMTEWAYPALTRRTSVPFSRLNCTTK